jgi:hypothetical protein
VDASLIAADANKQRSTPGSQWNKELDPQAVGRATKEYLARLDDAAFGAASNVTPKFVSPSDPAAQWTGAMRGPAFFAYSDNYLIDVKSGIIMDVQASRAIRQAEVNAAKTMIERTEQRFDIKPERLAGDTAYGSGANLNWLVNEAKIAPHIQLVVFRMVSSAYLQRHLHKGLCHFEVATPTSLFPLAWLLVQAFSGGAHRDRG